MVLTTVRLSSETLDRLNNLAKKTGRTKTYYIQKAIEEKIDELELIYLVKQRSEDVRAGISQTFTLDEVIAENGLSGQV